MQGMLLIYIHIFVTMVCYASYVTMTYIQLQMYYNLIESSWDATSATIGG